MILFKLCLFLILKGALAETNHEVMQLWRTQGNFDDDVLKTFYIRENNGEEIWIRDNKTIDFLLFEKEKKNITGFLRKHGMNYTVLIDNVRGKLDEALIQTFATKRSAVSGDSFTWTGYPNLREINAYLNKISKTYASHCKLVNIGKTHHAKPIYMLIISNGGRNNKAVLVDGGTHGREWTSVISVLYFVDNLVRNYNKQPAYVTRMDWHVIPVLNPDGYEYSLASDRLWKKNRRRLSGGCHGIDLNRNFDQFIEEGYRLDDIKLQPIRVDSGGETAENIWYYYKAEEFVSLNGTELRKYCYNFDRADDNICSEHYCGPVPFSEEETKAFRNVADRHFYGYLSVHSAGTKVLFPLGTTHDEHNRHLAMTKQIALAMRKVDKSMFVNGNMQRMGKKSYGMAMDWMYFVKNIPHSYVIETRGQNGFDFIQPKHILLAAKEVNAGLMKFAEEFK